MKRHDGRRAGELRPLAITRGVYEYALGSVLLELGKTKVLCAVTLQPSVPPFLRGQAVGWLTAEYALLPASTVIRTGREISQMKRQGRSVEISRLISRSLRTIVDLSVLPDRTLMIDCDVVQADGGTRIASINGAYIALEMAQEKLLSEGAIEKPFLKDSIAAVSIGVLADGNLVLDPDYKEDSEGIADINVIMTMDGKLIELQGGAEKEPISWDLMPQIGTLAKTGIEQLQRYAMMPLSELTDLMTSTKEQKKIPLFSLMNRQSRQPSL